MTSFPSRRSFIVSTVGLAACGVLSSLGVAQETSAPAGVPKAPPKPPALPPDRVKEAVSVAHGNLERLRALIEETPLLANACWDWGGGDFETPLQAAAHTGGREIAEYLLSKNARLDLYAAGMLGQLDFIKTVLAQNPRAHEIPGPHGFTLMHCVKKGGPTAQSVHDFLVAQGVPEVAQRPLPFIWPAA